MPRAKEIAEIEINGQRYSDFETVSVTRSGLDPFPKFAFTAASPIESAPSWSGMKLGIGDRCDIYLGGRKALEKGRILGRQPAFNAVQHGLQLSGTTQSEVTLRATVDAKPGEFKNYSLEAIANSLLKPFGHTFKLKGSTDGAEIPFPRVNVQVGETVYAAIERLCRMRNIYIQTDMAGNYVGYRLGNGTAAIADLQEGRNIKSGTAVFNYTGAFSEITSRGQRPGNDQSFGDAARDVAGTVKNRAVQQHAPMTFMAEMPGDQREMRMRAQHENGANLADQLQVQIVVQGWFVNDNSLWLEHVGDPVSVYSPLLFTDDRLNLAIQEVTATQGPGGTETTLTLVYPEAYNGGDQIQSGGTPAGLYNGA